MTLLLWSMGLLCLGAALSFVVGRGPMGARLGPVFCVVSCLLGFVAALSSLITAEPATFAFEWSLPVGRFGLLLDPLAGLFLLPVFLLGAASAVYGASSLSGHSAPDGKNPNLGAHWGFFLLTVLGLALCLTADNVFFFILSWELMSIAPFFCITLDHHHENVRQAGLDYLIAAHLGAACILGMFLHFGHLAGSLEFAVMGETALASRDIALLFLLGLIGFGAKVGLVPVHVWLPRAHPIAPSHVSAFLSGALIKAGLYGLLRLMTLLGPVAPWQGMTLIGVGLATALLGIIFVLSRQDLKTMLAYSSVENMGIILLGLGIGVVGVAHDLPGLGLLGFAGALLHVLNHALIKGLLFFCAGNVLHHTGTTALSKLGGLIRRMPSTTVCFGIGAMAIAGLPPMNGFLGELLMYIGAGKTAFALDFRAATPLFMAVAGLALVGGLAAAAMCKAFGLAFLGEPRTAAANEAREAGPGGRAVIRIMALACLAMTFAAPLLLMLVLPAAALFTGPPESDIVRMALRTLTMMVFIAAGLSALFAVLLFIRRRRKSASFIHAPGTWDCGFLAPSARMQYTGDSFSEPLTTLFQPISGVSRQESLAKEYFPDRGRVTVNAEDWVETRGVRTFFRTMARLCEALHVLQHGKTHLYIATVVGSLIVLLVLRGG